MKTFGARVVFFIALFTDCTRDAEDEPSSKPTDTTFKIIPYTIILEHNSDYHL